MKADLVQNGYDKCDGYIKQLEEGRLTSAAGRTEEETLEDHILKVTLVKIGHFWSLLVFFGHLW